MATTLTSTPDPAVTLTEAKGYFRVLHDDEDVEIGRVIDAASERAVNITNRVLTLATYEMTVDDFSTVELERTPFVEVVSVAYIATDDTTKPLTAYTIKVNSLTDRAMLSFTEVPTDLHEGDDQVTITYTAGYDPTPKSIQSYILAEALTMFENRHLTKAEGEIDAGTANFYTRLLDSYRIIPV